MPTSKELEQQIEEVRRGGGGTPSGPTSAQLAEPRRVEILRVEFPDRRSSYFKPGQYGYARAFTTHSVSTQDRGESAPGELSYLVSKTKDGKTGAVWFSNSALRFTSRTPTAGSATPARPAHSPWLGTDYNEKLANSAHSAIVGIYLDGVKGVSPERRGHGWRQISPDKADAYLAHARKILGQLAAQKPPRTVKISHDSRVRTLRDLLDKATAVRGGAPQKMTEADYEELRRSLGGR